MPADDRINSVLVKVEEPVPRFGQIYDVTIKISSGISVQGGMKMKDFRVLSEALNSAANTDDSIIGLDRTERINSQIPEWADNIALTNHFAGPKMRDRASILSDWLNRKVGKDVRSDHLIAYWLDSGSKFNVSSAGIKKDNEAEIRVAEAKIHKKRVEYPRIATTQFKWHKKDDQDISLEKNEPLAFWEDSEYNGWWVGEKVNGDKGLFPHNYVKELSPAATKAMLQPELAPSLPQKPVIIEEKEPEAFETNFGLGTKTDHNTYQPRENLSKLFNKPSSKTQKPRQRQKVTNYKLCCTEAFDQLLNKGVTIEENGQLARFDNLRDTPVEGDTVSLYYHGYLWEPQKQELLEFASSDKLVANNNPNNKPGPLVFKIGADQAIDGLEEAVKQLSLGQTVRITLSPDKAYQEVGFPPDIPGNAYLVYDITLQDIRRGNNQAGGNLALNNMGAMKNNVGRRQPSHRGFVQGGASMRRFEQQGQVAEAGVDPEKYKKKLSLEQLQKIVANKNFFEFGIDPVYVEEYLTVGDFHRAFGVQISQWPLLPAYKRKELKQKAGIF